MRSRLPRISSLAGVQARYDQRIATMPSGHGPKGGVAAQAGYRKPGSRNRKKLGRG
jgi:hypothetical protein